jgi:hypothetical protein
MANLTSTLTVRLIDNVTGPAGAASRALLGLGTAVSAANTRVNFGGIAGLGTALATTQASVNRFGASIQARMAAMGAAIYAESERIGRAASRLNSITWPAWFLGAAAGQQVLSFDRIGNAIMAVSDITAQQRRELEAYARQLNSAFPLTNTQIMQSALELSRAGFTFAQTMGALRGTLNLSVAGQLDPQQSADIATNILTAMRLPMQTAEQAAASMTRIVDMLSYAANQSAISVRDLGDTFRYVGPMAAAAGLSIEQVATAAMVMGNNGIRASEAGVALRSMLVRMVRPTAGMSAELTRLGINLQDFVRPGRQMTANDVIAYLGSSVSNPQQHADQINAALNDPALRGSLSALTRRIVDIVGAGNSVVDRQALEESVATALTASGSHVDLFGFVARLRELGVGVSEISRLFDVRQGGRLITLGVGGRSLDQLLEDFLRRSPGSGQRMADTMNQGLPRAWGEFTASIENLILRIADSGIRDRVISILDGLTSMVTALASVNPQILLFTTEMIALGAAAGGVMLAVGAIGRLVGILMGARTALTVAGTLATGAGATGLGTAGTAGIAGASAIAGAGARTVLRSLVRTLLRRAGAIGLAAIVAERAYEAFAPSWLRRQIEGAEPGTWGAYEEDMANFRRRIGLDRGWEGMVPPMPVTEPPQGAVTHDGGSLRRQLETEMGGAGSVASGAGQTAGEAYIAALREAIRGAGPELRRELEALLAQLQFNPTIAIRPMLDTSRLQGVHADVGADVAR